MIKILVFDLLGVLFKRKNISLINNEKILESKFGSIHFNDYYSLSAKELCISKIEVKKLVKNLILKLYESRENFEKNLRRKELVRNLGSY